MKRPVLLLVMIIFTSVLFAQSNVGIGTNSPKYPLHIHTAGANSYLNFTNGTTTDAIAHGLLIGMQNGASYLWNYENAPLFFATNSIFRMTIGANGNVGIGSSSSPAYLLDVQNRMRLRGGSANDISTTPGIWLDDYRITGSANAESAFFGMQDSIRLGFYGSGTGGVGWGMNFNTKNGKVNIGGYDGSYKFNISGSDLGIALYNASNAFYGSLTSGTGNHFTIESEYGNSFSGSTPKHILLNPPGSLFFYPGNVGVNVDVPTARMQVNGNMLLGSGSPATGYQLSVKGKVICEEAKVQLNAAWPDYVFADSYQKKSLYEVENYINENKHLPNIPSAGEVEKEGLLLGDMQKRMMEKVEELTLYLIEMKKENDQLKKRVLKLENSKK
jgi:hypothetical protein